MRASAERLAVAWAKASTPLNALFAGRVATRFPSDPPLPFLRVWKVTGVPDASEALDVVNLQWEIRAASPEEADVCERTLIAETMQPFTGVTVAGAGVLAGLQVSGSTTTYDEIEQWYGYRLDMIATVKEET